MRILNSTGNLPCGCDARREIMFTKGGMGGVEAAILAAALAAVLITWRHNR